MYPCTQADREASSIGLVPIALLGEASAGATAAAAASASPQPRSGSRPSSFGDAAGRQSMAASRRGTTTSRPATARTSASHALAMQVCSPRVFTCAPAASPPAQPYRTLA